ncbi:hypothetical protein BYT27DRAFT_7227146 [Phlegmacium glaucopus]|nr:hypothetical protein BYT27DRAFT_7227146 [Phlegmacium glaucopus]
MSIYPHSRLFIGATRTVDIAGPHIQVFETTTGHLLHSTAFIDEEQKRSVIKSGHVRCAAIDREFKYLITSGEDKMLKVWELEGLRLLSERELPKKPTSMEFTADAQIIIVSDKFGDIFSYPFVYVPLTVKQQRDALSSHENPSGGQLILGHASPLNAFLLATDEKYIVTADRDEHIRVSWYPKGYNIEMYCLGHLKFVSAIHIPRSDPASLISGGGDPMLKIWDWMTGVIKHEVAVLDAVEPFIAIRALKRKRGYDLDDGEDAPEGARIRRKKGHRKGKGKEKAKEKDDEADGDGGENEGEADEDEEKDSKPEKVLVIHKIDTLPSEIGLQVIFSAVGTTALFSFPYSDNFSGTEIQHFDFGRPVLDFMVGDGGVVVISLDGQWTSDEPDPIAVAGNSLMVRMVKMSSKGVRISYTRRSSQLFKSISTNTEDLKKLDLYSDLTLMPKYTADPENVTAEGPDVSMIASDQVQTFATSAKELSKKELGRMKSKQAVLAVKAKKQQRECGPDVEEPETKRARSAIEKLVE